MPLYSANPTKTPGQWFVWDICAELPPKPVYLGSMEDAGLVADALNDREARRAQSPADRKGEA